MPMEIERKFLVNGDAWRRRACDGIFYRQGYFTDAGTASVRVRIAGDKATLNIKGATLNISRPEYEYPIPLQDAEEMLAQFCEPPFIEKTRYPVPHGRHTWEVDVFEGDNVGLVVAEVELTRETESLEIPPWVGKEVSNRRRYYNVCLAKHPFKDW